MRLLRFILDEARAGAITITILLILLGAPFSFIGRVIGEAISGLPDHPAELNVFLAYLVVALTGFWMTGVVVTRMIALVERIGDRLRRRILDRVRALELLEFDRIGRAHIYFMVATHTRRISDATILFGRAMLALFGATACLIMLAWVSGAALVIVGTAMFIVGVVFSLNQLEIARTHRGARASELRFFDGMEGLVHGFKELRLNSAKDQAYFAAEVAATGAEAETARGRAGIRMFLNYLLYTVLILLASGACLYLLPSLYPELKGVAVHAAIIAGLIPLSVLRDLPLLSRAANAADSLRELEERLDHAVTASRQAAAPSTEGGDAGGGEDRAFTTLTLSDVSFNHTAADGEVTFAVGPLSFDISAGETTFIVGGNGSGKSTALKLVTGLYPPRRGSVSLNGVPVARGEQRRLISAVFADFQLFDRLYGYRDTPPERVREWLDVLHLTGRVDYVDGRFTDLRLSTGQRKRLALLGVLIEDRPILAFDEWAADQDPEYRQWFYRELLPLLRERGKTVIAVTHDDRYFDVADRVIRMDKGRAID